MSFLHSIKGRLIFLSGVFFLAIMISVSFSYFIAIAEVKNIMKRDINAVADALDDSVGYIASIKPDAYKDKTFKESICKTKIGKSGYVFMLDEKGTLVVHPKDEGKNLAGQKHIDHIISHRGSGDFEYTAKTTGQDKIVAYRYIEPWKLWIVPGVNKADYFDSLKSHFLKWNTIFTIVTILLLTALSIWITRSVTRPINKAVAHADRIAEGDLSVVIEVNRDEEAGKLDMAMQKMVVSMRRIAGQINSGVDILVSSADKLSRTTEELTSGAREQAMQTEQVASAMMEMSQTVVEVAKNAGEASLATTEASQMANRGRDKVGDTVAGMGQITSTVKLAAETISELGRSSQEIGNIASTIEDIADQTNLLALNAAIEAARAGEQGRGFAVVADEVRNLAERTGMATKEIAVMIKKIQSDTEKSVTSINSGIVEVENGMKIASEAKEALEQIVESSAHCTDMIQRIATATEEESATSDQVSHNMETIATVTKGTEASSKEILQATDELARVAAELKEATGWFKLSA